MSITRESLRDYLENTFGLEIASLEDEAPLFTAGLLDSFSVGDVLLFLEDTGGFRIEPHEVVPENLDSVAKLVDFAKRKSA